MKLVPLSTAAHITMGQSPPSDTYNKVGDGLPFFQGKADFGDLFPTVRVYCNVPKKVAEKGDILISVRAPVGPTNIAPLKSCIGRGLASIRAREGTNSKYILFFLRYYEPKLAEASRGSTFDAIGKEDLAKLSIPLPPLTEQKRIANVLDRANRLHRLRRYALELGDNYLQSVFLEMFGDPVANPMRWEMRKLGKHIKFITSGSRGWAQYYSPSGARFIRSLDVQMNYIANSDAVFVITPKSPETERTRVQVNDVLLTITGSRIGRVAPVRIELEEAYISQHVSLMRLDDELSPEYVSRFLSLPRGGQYQIAKSQYGQTKPGLNLNQIKDFKIPFPPKLMRKKFLKIVQHYERLRSQQRESLRQAEHLYQTLLNKMFTN